jgi:AcrR family transcriptional regulator
MVQKYQQTIVRKQQIINAARKLIIKRGSEHVTVRALAKSVGFSEGALYRHFKSKSDILSFLIDDIEDNLLGNLALARSNNQSSLQALDNLFKSHLSEIEQRKGVSFQVIAEIISLGDKKLNKKVYEAIDKYIVGIKELLSDGIDAGEIKNDINLSAAATLFFSMVQGLVSIWALSSNSFNLQERYEPLWNVYRSSISKH